MPYENVLLEGEGPVRRVTVNRPKALNALDAETVRELMRALREVRRSTEVRVLVLTGAGERAFVAGADIAAMEKLSAIEARRFSRLGHRLMRFLEELPIPVIAAVRGFALGGGLELALACDLVIAGSSARFGQPEINLGIIPGFGGTQRLSRRIGIARARELIYTGVMIDAAEALHMGLVNRVVEDDQLQAEVDRLTATLAEKAPIALGQAKSALNGGADIDLMTACRLESEAFGVTFATNDRREGMRAFLEKRKPKFAGS